MTRRKEIVELLKQRPYTIRELTILYCVETKEIEEDLKHIAYSIKVKRTHSLCEFCGFVFKEREKFKGPSKCPKCKNMKITEPMFSV